jgi:bacteriocin-like protein
MANEIELNEEQLASVTGGSFSLTSINQLAGNLLTQNNVAFAPTLGFATSGKKGETEFVQQGAGIGQGNIAVQSASNQA